MKSNDDLRAAVRGLRAAMGKTQTEFGAMVGKSLPTIQRYESLVPPKSKILIALEGLAREGRFDEYAQIFREAVRDELGVELPGTTPIPVALPFPNVAGIHVPGPHTPEQQFMHDILQVLMDQATWPSPNGDEPRKEMQLVNRAFRRVRLQLEDAGQGNQPLADRVAAVLRHRRDGMRPSQEASAASIAAKVDAALADDDLYECGEPKPSPETIRRVKELIESVECQRSIPEPKISAYFGEIDLTWTRADRLLRLIVFADASRRPIIYFQTDKGETLTRGKSVDVASSADLSQKLDWLLG